MKDYSANYYTNKHAGRLATVCFRSGRMSESVVDVAKSRDMHGPWQAPSSVCSFARRSSAGRSSAGRSNVGQDCPTGQAALAVSVGDVHGQFSSSSQAAKGVFRHRGCTCSIHEECFGHLQGSVAAHCIDVRIALTCGLH
jgi:hypothetical protein